MLHKVGSSDFDAAGVLQVVPNEWSWVRAFLKSEEPTICSTGDASEIRGANFFAQKSDLATVFWLMVAPCTILIISCKQKFFSDLMINRVLQLSDSGSQRIRERERERSSFKHSLRTERSIPPAASNESGESTQEISRGKSL